MLTINTNISALGAQRAIGSTKMRLDGNIGRLSSGQRINTAADDAAGLGISERLKSFMRSTSQAERNSNDGISLLQTAEGAMNEVSGMLTRMRELAVQSANGTLGLQERTYLDNEVAALRTEIDRIAAVTEFNGQTLFAGGAAGTTFTFQVGIDGTANDRITANVVGLTGADLGIAATSLTTVAGAQTALGVLDTAIDAVSSGRATLGAAQNRLQVTVANLSTSRENLAAANSRIRDVDVASETTEMARNNILMQSGVSVLAQANQMPQIALKLLG